MSESSDAVQLTVHRQIATVTLNRPDKRNAFDDDMVASLRRHFLELAQRDDLRAVVLRGAGDHFSAGADLHWMRRMAGYDFAGNLADARALAGMLQALFNLPMPTIAVVRGAAFGGAVGLIACCDTALATDDTVFALSEVRLGLVPATIAPYVMRAIGERACSRLFLTGERFDAQRALQFGLISESVTRETIDQAAQLIIDHICAGGPRAVRTAKRLVRQVHGQPIDAALVDDTSEMIAELRVSPEGQAGLTAFLEKQAPPWRSDGQ